MRTPSTARACRIAAGVVSILIATAAGAQVEPAAKPPSGISAAIGEVLNRAIASITAKHYEEAESALATLDWSSLSPRERSRAEQILFNVDFFEKRYDEARAHLLNAVDAGGLTPAEASRAQYQAAQLLMTQKKWSEGAAALEQWFATAVSPDANAYYLQAVAYYQMGDYARALPPAQRAVDLATEPKESWLQLVLALHIRRAEYADAVPVLQQLISLAPNKKTYWMQLSSVYGQAKDYRSALAITQLAYNAGFLTQDSEIRRFADLLLFNEEPARGARVLEAAIANESVSLDEKLYEKIADCWIAAGDLDKALPPLARAAELASTGDLFVKLGELHVQRSEFAAAQLALETGIRKGGLDDVGKAQYLVGVALFEQDRLEAARSHFESALSSDEWRDVATRYLRTIATLVGSQSVL